MDGVNDLKGQVAVVTGASRGAGRGVAVELGAAGATVYVTGRSTRGAPQQTYARFLKQTALDQVPGSIDETAEEVTRAGGRGVAVRCDHTDDEQVRALFERVMRDAERLDLLVNNAWGAHECFSGDFEARWRGTSLLRDVRHTKPTKGSSATPAARNAEAGIPSCDDSGSAAAVITTTVESAPKKSANRTRCSGVRTMPLRCRSSRSTTLRRSRRGYARAGLLPGSTGGLE
jgi:NAD(P)-dependent dehydrogenase (short-subunit alcohol dehydrogenase family)